MKSWSPSKRRVRLVALAGAALLGATLVEAPAAQAAGKPHVPDLGAGELGNRIVWKLGRGIINSVTGWSELPLQIWKTSKESEGFTGITYGTVKGVGMTVVRTGAGVWETATFFLPLPPAYESVIHPETIFEEEELARR